MSLKKNAQILSDLRKRGAGLLSRNLARPPQEAEIQRFVELEIDRIAEERVRRHQEENAEMASRAAVLRIR